MTAEPYLSVSAVSALLGIRPSTVRTWARDGVITGHRPGGRVWLFRESEVRADVERRPEPTPIREPRSRRQRPATVSTAVPTSLRAMVRDGRIGPPPPRATATSGRRGGGVSS